MLKVYLGILTSFFVIIANGQGEKSISSTKNSEIQFRSMKFEIEYAPLNDVQLVLLVRLKHSRYLGIRPPSSSFVLNSNKNLLGGVQTSIFISIDSTVNMEGNYISKADIFSVFYRDYFGKSKNNIYEIGLSYSHGSPNTNPFYMRQIGIESSYFHIWKRIGIGGSIQLGPIVNRSEDIGNHYGGFGICVSYLIFRVNIF